MKLSQAYRRVFLYLRSKRKELYLCISIFIISLAIGLFMPSLFLDFQQRLLDSILAQIEGKSTLGLITFIVLNNLQASLVAILLSFIVLLFPSVIIALNGFMIGAVASRALSELSFLEVIVKLVPHGLFEIPAVLIAYTLGMSISWSWFKKRPLHTLLREYRRALFVYVLVVVPLLLVAGVVEGLLITYL